MDSQNLILLRNLHVSISSSVGFPDIISQMFGPRKGYTFQPVLFPGIHWIYKVSYLIDRSTIAV